jgi:hypothetical protein
MGLIYHYTRFETFMSYIWPSGCIRTNSLRDINDPRESLYWSFGGTNIPYEEILKGDYSYETHFDCQYKLGEMIKDRYQVLCFSGSKNAGWNNEMMWAHYGGSHSGVCLAFDEDILLANLSARYPDADFRLENIDYFNSLNHPWINWQPAKSQNENMSEISVRLVKELVFAKSPFWEREDERRLVCINSGTQLYIPVQNAIRTVHLGLGFRRNGKEMVEAVFRTLAGNCKLSILIYQHNRFERWGMRMNSDGKIGTCDFEDLL